MVPHDLYQLITRYVFVEVLEEPRLTVVIPFEHLMEKLLSCVHGMFIKSGFPSGHTWACPGCGELSSVEL